MIFEVDGTLNYQPATAHAGNYKKSGLWKREGNSLSFLLIRVGETIDFQGDVLDGDTILGQSVFNAGLRVQQTPRRMTREKK